MPLILVCFLIMRLISTKRIRAARFSAYILTFHIAVSTLLVVVLNTVITTALIRPITTAAH